ncbi:MAG: hypothetical protein J6P19_03295, partial [Acetobacter sp.]|nr:hypothetical protein [Acetobacter sp.]
TLELYQHGKFEELCDALFNALEVDKHKRECNNYREIVENIISQEESKKRYIYHIHAIQIMLDKILRSYNVCQESDKVQSSFPPGSVSFFERVHTDISVFITQIKRFRAVKGGPGSYLGGARICSFSIGEAIRELAYRGTVCEGVSNYLQQGAVILIRHYIEVVIKEKYEEIYGKKIDSKIELYKLLEEVKEIATRQDKTEQDLKLIKAIFKDDDHKEILAHIETLHVIRNWANKFVHENKRHLFFWEPQIVYQYLVEHVFALILI